MWLKCRDSRCQQVQNFVWWSRFRAVQCNTKIMASSSAPQKVWSDFSPEGSGAVACALWRKYCDRLHSDLIAEWCGERKFRRALKTDVFDEAVGGGCFGALAAVAAEVHGIDVSGPLVEKVSREEKNFQVRVGDVRRLEFPDDSFDLVFSNSTLDHFETEAEIEQSISGFARVLEPGGCLLITLDNPMNPVVRVRNFLPQRATGAIGLVPYFMGRTLSMRGLADLLEQSGFSVRQRRHAMHAPRLVALHEQGAFKLEELLTRTYRLEEINEAYEDLQAGRLARGLVVWE
jgi:SAM-dependent methyltransferase